MDGAIWKELFMKIYARDLKTGFSESGRVTISFECGWKAKASIEMLKKGDYELDIKSKKDQRTMAQNRYLWELIGQIAMKENGNKAEAEDIYMQLLEAAGAKCEYLEMLEMAVDRFTQLAQVKFIKIVERRIRNGKPTVMCKCFYGSSKMDTKEMGILIDKTIERAEADGIDTEAWKMRFYDTE